MNPLDGGTIDVTASMRRRLAWDVLPCPEQSKYFPMLGLMAGSEEGDEMEHKDSHHRLNQIGPIIHLVAALSSFTGEILCRASITAQGGDGASLEATDVPMVVYKASAYTMTSAVIANLLAMGVIKLTEPEEWQV